MTPVGAIGTCIVTSRSPTLTSTSPTCTTATATAITTFMTGLAPQQHGLTGWHVYLKELGCVTAVLPTIVRPSPVEA